MNFERNNVIRRSEENICTNGSGMFRIEGTNTNCYGFISDFVVEEKRKLIRGEDCCDGNKKYSIK